MSALHNALTEYLATRRALGTQLLWPEPVLRGFVDFVEAQGAEFITTELALGIEVRWRSARHACSPASNRPKVCWVAPGDGNQDPR